MQNLKEPPRRSSILSLQQKDMFSELRQRCFTRLRQKRQDEIKLRRQASKNQIAVD
jgi:hypothetical protein